MTAASANPFFEAMQSAPDPTGFALVTVLAWIAASDGVISAEELAQVRELAGDNLNDLELVLAETRRADPITLRMACQQLQMLPPRHRELALTVCIGVALADGRLSNPEIHIIFFPASVTDWGVQTGFWPCIFGVSGV